MKYNPISIITLYKKEVQRFTKIPLQTIVAPAATSLLFMVIFTTAIGSVRTNYPLDSFKSFLFPGLIMMTIIQNAFMNNSSSILMSKVQGNIVDLLMPPLGPGEILTAMVAAAVTRGVLVAFVCIATFWFFNAIIPPPSLLTALLFLLLGAAVMAMAGLIAGVWAQKFEHLSAITNFIVQPLAFLSGTFYSIGRLPAPFDTIAGLNPFFMIIDGFRYGMMGLLESYLGTSFIVVLGMTFFLAIICFRLLATGFRLKS